MEQQARQKLYCYVDETGQDTEGEFFLVALVVTGEERDDLLLTLQQIERSSGKGSVKWNKARLERRLLYLEAVLACPNLAGKLYFACFGRTKEYEKVTVIAAAKAILMNAAANHKATVVVDGLQRSHIPDFARRLRYHGVHVKKVIGLKDESNELIRLADATAGFVRDGLEGKDYAAGLLQRFIERQYLKKLE